jgi:RNA polymerase sigma factor (sigma-70 family)
VSLSQAADRIRSSEVDILDLDAALDRLSGFDPRKSRIAELRFFGGLSLREIANLLGLSIATVERDWQASRAWLYAAIKGTHGRDSRALARRH